MMIEQVDGLMAEGLTETQATGQVIATFDSLEGVADELLAARTRAEPTRPTLPLEEAQRYTNTLQETAPRRATATALFITAPATLFALMGFLPDSNLAILAGFIALLLLTVALSAWLRVANGWPQASAVDLTNSEYGALALGRSAEDENAPENSSVTWVRVVSTAL